MWLLGTEATLEEQQVLFTDLISVISPALSPLLFKKQGGSHVDQEDLKIAV